MKSARNKFEQMLERIGNLPDPVSQSEIDQAYKNGQFHSFLTEKFSEIKDTIDALRFVRDIELGATINNLVCRLQSLEHGIHDIIDNKKPFQGIQGHKWNQCWSDEMRAFLDAKKEKEK
jgi:hypothetical protein